METWKTLSIDSLLAAEVLLRERRYRSSVSRSYYAAYCATTYEITLKITSFPYGWNNPPHVRVPRFIQNNLPLSQKKKDIIIALINTLRLFREDADYRPTVVIDAAIANDCYRDAFTLQQELWGSFV